MPANVLVRCLLAALTVVVSVVPSAAEAGETNDPYGSDPLGLVAHYDLTTELGAGPDVFEVWMCYITGGPYGLSQVTAEQFVPVLAGLVGAYWEHASGGAYRVSFVAGGNITDPEGGCRSGVRAQSEGAGRAGLIVESNSNVPVGGSGMGGAGRWCDDGRSVWWCHQSYPENRRDAVVQAGGGPQAVPLPSAVVHEIGHTLGFPHSYTGLLPRSHLRREYDNPMDIMSGGGSTRYSVGMIAVNRYAAGWIPAEQVHVYRSGTEQVVLANRGAGVLMLAVPSGEAGWWLSVGARTEEPFNAAPADGVEVYVVDERPSACDDPHGPVCWGTKRLVTPHPTDRNYPLAHVLSPGDTIAWQHVTLTVVSETGGAYRVEISDGTAGSGRFVDDDGNVHEADIERIAGLGITRGCATGPERLYCPDRSVTRAEMAAFVLRAIGQPNPQPSPAASPFEDVADDQWYTPFVLTAAQMGIDTGAGGRWRPDDPLTRLEMAQWLTRAFDHIIQVTSPEGLFDDVPQEHWHVVEGLHRAGVTRGCSAQPLRYCPDQAVTRAQMASFIARSLPD